MNCPQCNAPIRPGARFCARCGTTLSGATQVSGEVPPEGAHKRTEDLPPTISAPEQTSPVLLAQHRAAAEALINDFLREGGVADPESQIDEEGRHHFTFGSAHCRAAIVEDEGQLYLHVDAFVMKLPSDKELIVPLMRELLELNLMLRGAVRVGISGELVIAVAIRPLEEMYREEFTNCIFSVMSVADHIDDMLLEKYGGTAKQRQPA
jgi:hypothetical protein